MPACSELGRTEAPAPTRLKVSFVNGLETSVLGRVEVSAQMPLKLLANRSGTPKDLAPGRTEPLCLKVLMMSEYEVFERPELGRTEMPASTHSKALLANELETSVLGWVEVSVQALLKLLANESRTLEDLALGSTKPSHLKVLLMSECEVFRRLELG